MDIDFDVIQNACSPRTWKIATTRFSSMQVDLISENSDNVEFLVGNSNNVRIYFNSEWNCDCNGPVDPCVHVAVVVNSIKNKTYVGQPHKGLKT